MVPPSGMDPGTESWAPVRSSPWQSTAPGDVRIACALDWLMIEHASMVQQTTWVIFLVYFDEPFYTRGHCIARDVSRIPTILHAAIAEGAADDEHRH
jgi:hypothetical protein